MLNRETTPSPYPVTRRKLLAAGAAGALGVAGAGLAIWTKRKGLWLGRLQDGGAVASSPRVFDFRIADTKGTAPIAIVTGASAAGLAKEALKSLGGMELFVKRGDRVLIKPNAGWDRRAELAANTNPDVIRTLCEMCLTAGAGKVIVSDFSCNETHRCFDSSGIGAAARSAGAEVVFPREAYLKEIDFNGEAIRSWPVYSHFLEVDKLINVPIAKQHGLARVTLGMKNWFGIIGGLRNRLHQNINTSIVDLATSIRPTLTVIDAYRILISNGPQGGRLADVKDARTLIASTDPVAADSLATALFGLNPEDLPYLPLAHSRGLGQIDRAAMSIRELTTGA